MLLIDLCFFNEDEPMRLTSVKKVDWVFKADYWSVKKINMIK